jgi:spore coat protein U-like protein
MRRLSLRFALLIVVAVAITVAAFADPASAKGTGTAPFTVSAKVISSCSFGTASNFSFAYAIGQTTAAPGQTTFTITCPGLAAAGPVPVKFTFSTSSGLFKMRNGPNGVDYELCNDAACSQVYAQNVAGPTIAVGGTPFAVYANGVIPGGQGPAKRGNFSQTVTAVLTY